MRKTKFPKVSVCIPTYNYGNYIADAVESVRSQTYSDFELLVIDDCSVDNTREIVGSFIKRDERIRYIQNENRLGFVGNFSRCIELATGEYVKILCADDVLDAAYLQKMVRALEEHNNVSLVSCSRQLVDNKLQPLGFSSYAQKTVLQGGAAAARNCFFKVNNLIGEPTAVLFRKKDAERGFNNDYTLLVDLEMWFHLLEKGDFLFISESFCKIRQHEKQATNDCVKARSFVLDLKKIYTDFSKKPYMRTTFLNAMRWRFGAVLVAWEKRGMHREEHVLRETISPFMNYRVACIVMPFYVRLVKVIHKIKNRSSISANS